MAEKKEFLDIARERFSCRKYIKDKEIKKEDILKCIEAARIAPSASNSQPWKYVIVDDIILKEKIVDFLRIGITKFNQFAKEASAIIVVVEEPKNLELTVGQVFLGRNFANFDIGCSVMQFCLEATELGLGTCILGIFDEKKIKKLLKIPKNKRISILISIGYPQETIKVKNRKEIERIFSFNQYN